MKKFQDWLKVKTQTVTESAGDQNTLLFQDNEFTQSQLEQLALKVRGVLDGVDESTRKQLFEKFLGDVKTLLKN